MRCRRGSGCTDLLKPPDGDDRIDEDREQQQGPIVIVPRKDTENCQKSRGSPHDEPWRVLRAPHLAKVPCPRQRRMTSGQQVVGKLACASGLALRLDPPFRNEVVQKDTRDADGHFA